MNADVSAFHLIKTTTIESLNIQFEEYQHLTTGARHIHLAADNKENVFMVALRTVPTDSTGVAHILEHTSLCGSKRFPVRDPFFMMIRRSLNTFMNAFTSSDWTAYPFASQNKKDFNNLLEVYLDAVFFARLDPLDFSQEGHRLEFEEPTNADSDLVYKGVVFNEMKGAMSSISSQLWQAVGESLFPDTTYGVNSGGEPENITDLSYQQLQDFYQTHYHPDNAIFVTFGDIDAKEHQLKIQELALKHFSPLDKHIEVPLQNKFSQSIRSNKSFPISEEEANGDKTHLVMAWVLGSIRDPLELMSTHLLAAVLLENSASPLQHALETTDLGSAPSPLCGMDDSGLEMVFVCGVEGSSEDKVEALEKLIIDTLQSVADNGVDIDRMTALLDQLELQQREVGGGGYPYGLQLMLSCLPTAIHRGDAAAALNIDPVLSQLRESIQDPHFIKSLVKRLLINNQHRVTLVMSPDTKLSQARIEQEQQK
ncbi:MAG: insulinase family protein, partial [Pseudomonadales bacterium]